MIDKNDAAGRGMGGIYKVLAVIPEAGGRDLLWDLAVAWCSRKAREEENIQMQLAMFEHEHEHEPLSQAADLLNSFSNLLGFIDREKR